MVCRGSVADAEKLLGGVVPDDAVDKVAVNGVGKQDQDDGKCLLDVLSTRRLKQALIRATSASNS